MRVELKSGLCENIRGAWRRVDAVEQGSDSERGVQGNQEELI
jgi:hypothetical protein